MIFFINTLFAGKIDVTGNWLVYKAITQKGTMEPYQPAGFNPDGTFTIMNMPVGEWKMKGKLLNLKTRIFEKQDEDYTIKQDGDEKMILKGKTQTLYLLKLNPNVVANNNKASGLVGLWQAKGDYPEMKRIFEFSAPGILKITETEPGSMSNYNGNWAYFPGEKEVVLMVMGTDLKGKYKVEVSGDGLTLTNSEKIINVEKLKPQSDVEHLSFREEDFYDDNGDYKYDDEEQKLPWQDVYGIISNLGNFKKLVYECSELSAGAVVPDKKTLTAYVQHHEGEDKVCVDYIFNGYDKDNLPEGTQLPSNCLDNNGFNKLFPLKDDAFRVVKKEQITVPAGTFDCTVVEATGDFEAVQKMWLIDDNPGVYAKIIIEKKDKNFGFNKTFVLKASE